MDDLADQILTELHQSHVTYLAIYERCVCNQRITSMPFYGMEFPEQDAIDDEATILYFDASHDQCMNEWGLARDDSEIGLAHLDY